jgi:hypothetical protein
MPTELQSGGIEEFNKGLLYILKEFAELDKPKQEIISFMKIRNYGFNNTGKVKARLLQVI